MEKKDRVSPLSKTLLGTRVKTPDKIVPLPGLPVSSVTLGSPVAELPFTLVPKTRDTGSSCTTRRQRVSSLQMTFSNVISVIGQRDPLYNPRSKKEKQMVKKGIVGVGSPVSKVSKSWCRSKMEIGFVPN